MITVFFCAANAQKKTVISEKKMVTVSAGNYQPFLLQKTTGRFMLLLLRWMSLP
jgi:hypothetical protein